MAKIDNVRRECEDLGTYLSRYKYNSEYTANPEAMAALATIHTRSISPEPEPTLLTQQLDEFRTKFKIDPKIASNYRVEA